jgi:hypothetical protein
MSSLPVHLAIEDELSEAVLRRLLAETNRGYTIGTAYGRSGYGYLRKTIGGWNHAAKGVPFVVLTDLDDAECAPSLINECFPVPKHPNLLFRVAELARKSRFGDIRTRVVPKRGTAKQGPDYNTCLSGFVGLDAMIDHKAKDRERDRV